MQPPPLAPHLAAAGATLADVLGAPTPLTFGDDAAARAAARDGVAVAPLAWLTHVVVRGRHRGRFVHNFTTCQVKALQPGGGNYGLIVNGKGGLVAQILLDAEPDALRMELARPVAEAALAHLRKYVVADDVRFEPADAWAVLMLLGPRAEAALAAACGAATPSQPAEAPRGDATASQRGEAASAGEAARTGAAPGGALGDPARPYAWREVRLGGVTARVRRNPQRLGCPGLDVTVAHADAPAAWDALVAQGATPLGHRVFEELRVAAGVPREGADMDDEDVPLEAAALAATIDWNKGCYLGQEVICMMNDLGKPRRHLMALRLPAGQALPAPGAALLGEVGGKAIGRVGTALVGPDGPIALAMIKRKHAVAGATVVVAGGAAATVAALPLGG